MSKVLFLKERGMCMADLIFSFNIIMPIFLLLMLGYYLKKIKMFDDNFLAIANNFTFKVLLPVLLFTNVFTTDILSAFNLRLVLFAVIGVILIFLCLLVLVPMFEKDKKKIGVMIQGIFRSNFILFGVPLSLAMYGEQGAAQASVVAACYVPVINILSTLSLYIFSEQEGKSIKKCLIGVVSNPLVIGGFSGILCSLIRGSLGVSVESIPPFVITTLEYIKGSATPLAFIILGADLKFDSMFNHMKYMLVGCGGRLVVIPVLGLLVAYLMNYRGLEFAILIAVLATPNAVSSYAMARNFEADYEIAGELVAASTIFSIITMFLFIYASRLLGLI